MTKTISFLTLSLLVISVMANAKERNFPKNPESAKFFKFSVTCKDGAKCNGSFINENLRVLSIQCGYIEDEVLSRTGLPVEPWFQPKLFIVNVEDYETKLEKSGLVQKDVRGVGWIVDTQQRGLIFMKRFNGRTVETNAGSQKGLAVIAFLRAYASLAYASATSGYTKDEEKIKHIVQAVRKRYREINMFQLSLMGGVNR